MLDKTRRTFELIRELDSIFREHNIEYIVGGLAARAAIEKKNLEFPCSDVYVSKDCKDKLAGILASGGSHERSFISSEKGIYYVDETTTFIDRDNPAAHGHYGINIHIIFIGEELLKSFGEINSVDYQGFTVNLPSKSKEYYNKLFVRDGKKAFPSYPNFRCIISTTVSYKQIAENMPELKDYLNSFLENKKEIAEATERINVRDKIVKDVLGRAEDLFIQDDSSLTFSVVMPVYNTEPYLREAIDSVVNQSVGFEDNIQLILVNDGSTDGSGEICLEYKDKYPANVVYYAQENKGVAAAKNAGLKFATGRYINVMSSDDIWDTDTFKNVKEFFDNNYNLVDVVTCKVKLFGTSNGEHIQNFRFGKDAVVDLDIHPEYCQCADGNCFIKAAKAKGLEYDEELGNAEDALFINTILMDTGRLGVVSDTLYYYRKRDDGITSNRSTVSRYTVEPYRFQKRLYEMSVARFGYVKPFIAFTVMYEMQWRISEIPPEEVSAEDLEKYTEIQKELLKEIKDEYIFKQKSLSVTKKIFVYKLKYGDSFTDKLRFDGKNVFYNTTKVYDISARSQCKVREMHTENGMLIIEGLVALGVLHKDYKMILKRSKGQDVVATITRSPEDDQYAFNGDRILEAESFRFEVPIVTQDTLTFYGQIENHSPVKMLPMFEEELPLDHNLKNSFWNDKKCIVKYFGDALHVYKYSLKTYLASRHRFNKELTNKEG